VPIPLAIHHTPICLSFAFFGDGSIPVSDPNHLESQLSTGNLTLTLNAQREICVLTKSGGAPMEADEILRVVNLAAQRVKEIDEAIKSALEQDAKGRVVGAL
jgi:exosome complex component RRP45